MRRTVLLMGTMLALVMVAGGTALAGHFGLHVELSPDGETKPVYSEHTVTAEVSNIFVPSAGATVVFDVIGPDGTFSYTTQADENSLATLTFDNPGLAGTYTISAAAELQSSSALSSSTLKLFQWNEKKRKWQRVPADAAHAPVDCTRFGATCLAMPKPACQIWEQCGELQGTCEVPTLDPYPSDPSRLLRARKEYRAVVTTGAQDLNGDALAKAYAWKFTTGR